MFLCMHNFKSMDQAGLVIKSIILITPDRIRGAKYMLNEQNMNDINCIVPQSSSDMGISAFECAFAHEEQLINFIDYLRY